MRKAFLVFLVLFAVFAFSYSGVAADEPGDSDDGISIDISVIGGGEGQAAGAVTSRFGVNLFTNRENAVSGRIAAYREEERQRRQSAIFLHPQEAAEAPDLVGRALLADIFSGPTEHRAPESAATRRSFPWMEILLIAGSAACGVPFALAARKRRKKADVPQSQHGI
jgi:hypothetical protein